MDTELREFLEAMKAELKADIERTETKLLTEFHKWASPAEARSRSHQASSSGCSIGGGQFCTCDGSHDGRCQEHCR